jgi:hypothetical protein
MYKLIILLAFTFLSFVAISQNIYSAYYIFFKNDIPALTWETNGLKGKVKEINYANVYLNEDPANEERVKFGKRLVFYKDGLLDSIFIRNHPTNYIFEPEFHYYRIGDTVYSTLGSKETKTVFNKNRLPIYYYDNWSQFENWFTYDKQKRILSVKTKTFDQTSHINYRYKNLNDNISVVSEGEGSDDYFQLNKSMQKIMQVYFKPLQTEKTVITYKYDTNGNLTLSEETTYRKDGYVWKPQGKVRKIEYRYKYDTQKNWIEKRTIDDGVLFEIEKRRITYWQDGT